MLALSGGTKVFLPDYESALAGALGERDIAVALHQGMLTLVCGQLARERADSEIMEAIGPVLAAYPPASRIGKIVHFGRALPRTAAGEVERWRIRENA